MRGKFISSTFNYHLKSFSLYVKGNYSNFLFTNFKKIKSSMKYLLIIVLAFFSSCGKNTSSLNATDENCFTDKHEKNSYVEKVSLTVKQIVAIKHEYLEI